MYTNVFRYNSIHAYKHLLRDSQRPEYIGYTSLHTSFPRGQHSQAIVIDFTGRAETWTHWAEDERRSLERIQYLTPLTSYYVDLEILEISFRLHCNKCGYPFIGSIASVPLVPRIWRLTSLSVNPILPISWWLLRWRGRGCAHSRAWFVDARRPIRSPQILVLLDDDLRCW